MLWWHLAGEGHVLEKQNDFVWKQIFLRLCYHPRVEELKILQFEISKAFARRRRLFFLAESARSIMWPEYAFIKCDFTNKSLASTHLRGICVFQLLKLNSTFPWPFSVSGWQNRVRFRRYSKRFRSSVYFFKTKPFNPLNTELNPICQ